MEYTKKHQNLIAKFFKKVGMPEAAQTILTCSEYDHEIALSMREAQVLEIVKTAIKPFINDKRKQLLLKSHLLLKDNSDEISRKHKEARSHPKTSRVK